MREFINYALIFKFVFNLNLFTGGKITIVLKYHNLVLVCLLLWKVKIYRSYNKISDPSVTGILFQRIVDLS